MPGMSSVGRQQGKGAGPLCNPQERDAMTEDAVAKLRISGDRKARYQAVALAQGNSLSGFIRMACDQAAAGLNTAARRGDLAVLRRHLNIIASFTDEAAEGGLDRQTVRRLAQESAAMRAIIDRHLAVG